MLFINRQLNLKHRFSLLNDFITFPFFLAFKQKLVTLIT